MYRLTYLIEAWSFRCRWYRDFTTLEEAVNYPLGSSRLLGIRKLGNGEFTAKGPFPLRN